MKRSQIPIRFFVALALGTPAATGMLAITPVSTSAAVQAVNAEDPRWFPFLGCWEPTGPEVPAVICVTAEGAGARLDTHIEGEVPEHLILTSDGSSRAVEVGGCEGTRRASWSEDGRRIFFDESLRCGPEAVRTTRGVLALVAQGSAWVEIQAISVPGLPDFLSVRNYRPASPSSIAAFGVVDPAPRRDLAIQTARGFASRGLEVGDIVESVRWVGSAATGALVAEVGAPFRLSSDALRGLRAQGVPAEVLDLMIAVTWPDRFEIRGTEVSEIASAPSSDPSYIGDMRSRTRGETRIIWGPVWGSPYDPWRYGAWGSPYGAHPFGGYGVSGYGWGGAAPYGYGWGPGGYIGRPLVVVVGGGSAAPAPRGTVTPEGYVRPGGASADARRVVPAPTQTSTPPAATPPSSASPPAASPPAVTPPVTRPAIPRTQTNTTGGGGGGGD